MQQDTDLHNHIRARIKRKPNRIMKRSFIESALCYHKIVILLMGMLVLVGVAGIVNMPKQEMPVFTIRQGAVVAVCPGSNAQEVEQRVTKPLEDFIFGYKEVSKRKTYSQTKDGMAIVYMELNADIEDKDAFWSKFKHGLSAFKMQLPSSVAALQAVDDIAETSALLITLESGQKTYRELRQYLDDLKSRLRRIDAISNLRTYGLEYEQLTIELDQQKMAKYGIGSFTILNSLAMQGLTTYSGSVTQGGVVAPIHISDAYSTEADVANQIVYSSSTGDIIRLKDIAQIKREYASLDKYIKAGGKKCVLLSVEMRPGNDIVKMGRDVRQQINIFKQELPSEVNLNIITDQSRVVSESVLGFLRELLISIISVIIVVVLLMPRRVAEVSALSIPITIFTSVGIFYIFGFELNTVTLAALIVTLGMVVDDSVVIIDNYMEKLGQGMSRWRATIAAPREFFMSVLSATLSISLTFFPFLFTMKGEMADFVKSFPWAMFIILSVSLTVSLVLTPYLQYKFIHEGIKQQSTTKRRTPLDFLQSAYTWLLSRCFNHKVPTLAFGAAVIAVGVMLFLRVPQRMMPLEERDQFAVEIYLPNGASAARTAVVADSLEQMLRADSRVKGITTFIGQGSPRFNVTYAPQVGGKNFAQLIVNTIDNKSADEVLDDYADKYSEHFPDAYVRFKQMDYNNAIYPIEIRISGDSINSLKAAAAMVQQCMRSTEGLQLIRTNYEDPQPGVKIVLNETEANRLGINKALLTANLAVSNGDGVPVASLWEADYPVSVVLKTRHNDSTALQTLADEYIPVMGGTTAVPLRQFASVQPDFTDGSIVRRNGVRTISVVAEPKRGYNPNSLTREVQQKVKKLQLPQGLEWTIGGMLEKDAETMPEVASGVMIAVLIIFFILLFHFKRISLALVNLSAMSLCVFGAAIGLLVAGYDMSITAILGVVSLMGILVRNGIIMIDYAEELRRDKGISVSEAAFCAGERRMRPIFLTSVAAAVGVLPMMLEHNTLWSPMAAVVFFGTLISMVLIATILPVLYSVVFTKAASADDRLTAIQKAHDANMPN